VGGKGGGEVRRDGGRGGGGRMVSSNVLTGGVPLTKRPRTGTVNKKAGIKEFPKGKQENQVGGGFGGGMVPGVGYFNSTVQHSRPNPQPSR